MRFPVKKRFYAASVLACAVMITAFFMYRSDYPDLGKKEDLKSLGKGRIIETDNTVINQIELYEIKEQSIVYVKDGSLHDMPMEDINRLEFRNSKWGPLKITFPMNKPVINRL